MIDTDREITPKLHQCIRRSKEIAKEIGHSYAGREHMLLALLESGGAATKVLVDKGVTKADILREIGLR